MLLDSFLNNRVISESSVELCLQTTENDNLSTVHKQNMLTRMIHSSGLETGTCVVFEIIHSRKMIRVQNVQAQKASPSLMETPLLMRKEIRSETTRWEETKESIKEGGLHIL